MQNKCIAKLQLSLLSRSHDIMLLVCFLLHTESFHFIISPLGVTKI